MVRLYVRHPVEDFDHWMRGYSANTAFREEGGVLGDAVYRSVDDPNDVTVWTSRPWRRRGPSPRARG